MSLRNKNKVKIVVMTLVLISVLSLPKPLAAQDDEEIWRQTYQIRQERKSASRAILFSTIFPGSGHFYVNKRSFGTYIFPLIEIGLWVGYFHFDKKGSDIEKDYMRFADANYRREYQHEVEDELISHTASSIIYNDSHFRLDQTNTQHFYEDIGKYNKYIFGWEDWYEKYAANGIQWSFNDEGIWLGNYPTDGTVQDEHDSPYSTNRAKYIQMRRDAQENFDNRVLATFGLAFNRIVSTLDVVRVTTKYNRELRYSSNYDVQFKPVYVNNMVTPSLNFQYRF